MKKINLLILGLSLLVVGLNIAKADTPITTRKPQINNNQVNVWETVIYPSENQKLKMHRHEYDRVVVAFDDGILKITNDKGQTHYLKLEKGQSYFLTKDVPNELHMDENISQHPIKVIVIELKNS